MKQGDRRRNCVYWDTGSFIVGWRRGTLAEVKEGVLGERVVAPQSATSQFCLLTLKANQVTEYMRVCTARTEKGKSKT
jgi:hypothetical protein